tara:strand:- start:93 stop:332 length:240 start_codon:yes stop_codon:yes gene_type:complete
MSSFGSLMHSETIFSRSTKMSFNNFFASGVGISLIFLHNFSNIFASPSSLTNAISLSLANFFNKVSSGLSNFFFLINLI